jgi:tRNA threonylcarbamoyladenosine biosynthesis protein TsaE
MVEQITILERQYSLEDLPGLVEELLDTGFMDEKVCILVGDLGAGKTTIVQAIVSIFALDEKVTSPTFSLINEYDTKNGDLYHMDLYRLNSLEEALDIGIEEYFYKGNCFIEWPQIIEDILPETYYIIEIENLGNFVRLLKLRRVSNK